MPDFTVVKCGTDSSGRTIWMTSYMRDWWGRVVDALGFEPTIVQGAFMVRSGGGATDSAGYHDAGGCLDLRTWDRTDAEVEETIRTLRRFGAAAWRRDQRHGMDPHIHFVLGTDEPLAYGAAQQWRAYLVGQDGLASNGRDYEWRPSPLVLKPPKEDDMFSDDDRRSLTQLTQAVADLAAAEKQRAKDASEREARRFANLRTILKERFGSTDAELDQILGQLES